MAAKRRATRVKKKTHYDQVMDCLAKMASESIADGKPSKTTIQRSLVLLKEYKK